ncbi:uncharacterized protein METZ01_LOCUS206744 [marine metagenome]|uniref:Uncharacterized protein n=1 Tax=marine metagenome TaxID=408172 RepID=A0A382ET25_9ZZZZ
MIFDDLNEKNFLLYAMKEYNNPQCTKVEEFNDDLKKIKYIKRLLNQYVSEGVLKERLLLNHIIIFYNVFPPAAATRILFFKIEEKFWPILKPFLFYLKLMPEDKIESIMGKEIRTNEILMDQGVIDSLRKFDKES